MEQPEEFEHIPWSELSSAHQAGRNRLAYIAAGALVAVAVGAVTARSLLRPSPAPVTVSSAVEAVEAVEAPDVEESVAPTQPDPVSVGVAGADPVIGGIYREADLMAALPVADGARAAVARAEWFVADYFTADLDPLEGEPIRAALPAGASVPPLPQERAAPPVSFVEWSRAFDAVPVASDIYRVAVAFRSIGSTSDGRFRRLPVRAVEVTVVVGPDGGTSVADLPAPRELPQGPLVAAWPEESLTLPDAVVGGALQQAARWGDNPQIAGGADAGGQWRVVVTAQDEVGNRWPLTIHLDGAGNSVATP